MKQRLKILFDGIIDADIKKANYLELSLIFICHVLLICFSMGVFIIGISLLLGLLKLITLFTYYFLKL